MNARLKKKLVKLGCLGRGTTKTWLRLRAWADDHPKWDCSDRSVEKAQNQLEKKVGARR